MRRIHTRWASTTSTRSSSFPNRSDKAKQLYVRTSRSDAVWRIVERLAVLRTNIWICKLGANQRHCLCTAILTLEGATHARASLRFSRTKADLQRRRANSRTMATWPWQVPHRRLIKKYRDGGLLFRSDAPFRSSGCSRHTPNWLRAKFRSSDRCFMASLVPRLQDAVLKQSEVLPASIAIRRGGRSKTSETKRSWFK